MVPSHYEGNRKSRSKLDQSHYLHPKISKMAFFLQRQCTHAEVEGGAEGDGERILKRFPMEHGAQCQPQSQNPETMIQAETKSWMPIWLNHPSAPINQFFYIKFQIPSSHNLYLEKKKKR